MEEKEERLEEEAKKSHYSNLLSQMLKDDSDTESALRVTKELLLMNPEHYHAWNKRKQSLLISDSTLSSVIIDELEFSVETLKLNPKSYPSWYHRRWLLSKVQQEITKAIAPNELRLCSKLLQLDARNFHCWNYRAFLCDEILHVEPEQELKYTGELITKNFSNYSAWHRRAVVTLRMELNGTLYIYLKSDLKFWKKTWRWSSRPFLQIRRMSVHGSISVSYSKITWLKANVQDCWIA